MKTMLFSRDEISQIVELVGFDRLMDETIDALTRTCEAFDRSAYSIPVRSGFSYNNESNKGLLEWMPVMRYGDCVVIKLVGYHPNNPQQFNLPTVLSTVVTFDARDGHATSIVDGTFITSLRTGAASAVASAILANPGSTVLGLVGAGAQAVTQLHALSRKFDLERILIYDTDISACNSFAERAACAGLNLPIEICSGNDVLRRSEIVCTSTSIDVGSGPLFEDLALRGGVHINAVGSDFPGKFELPVSLLNRSLVCPDFRDQALNEGECQQLESADVGPELSDLVKQRAHYTKYRSSPTVFDSTGWALEDLVASEMITRIGLEAGCGNPIDLQCIPNDPKNPYGFVKTTQSIDEEFSLEKLLLA